MVVKKRFRTILFLALFYTGAGTVIYFFLSEAQNGNRGIETNKAHSCAKLEPAEFAW